MASRAVHTSILGLLSLLGCLVAAQGGLSNQNIVGEGLWRSGDCDVAPAQENRGRLLCAPIAVTFLDCFHASMAMSVFSVEIVPWCCCRFHVLWDRTRRLVSCGRIPSSARI